MMKKIIISLLLLVVMVSGETAIVVKVVDGDTIKVNSDGKIHNIRLAGVDTPESYMSKKAKSDIKKCKVKPYIMMHLGLSAKEFVMSVYKPGDKIKYTKLTKGRYNRDVVFVEDLELDLVIHGYAVVKHYNKTDKYIIKLLKPYEAIAIDNKEFMWEYLRNKCY